MTFDEDVAWAVLGKVVVGMDFWGAEVGFGIRVEVWEGF
jgi:hypothetical protein